MIVAIKPYKDATIYEAYPEKNTGLDEILEIQKTISGSSYAESRPVLYFNTADINKVLTDNAITVNDITCSLILNTVQYSEVPLNYIIEVNAISGSWSNGTGKFADTDLNGGVSWVYREGENNLIWITGSYAPDSIGEYNTFPGGGTWYISSACTQSFSFKQDNDVNVDVTAIVSAWLNEDYDNDGMIVRLLNLTQADVLLPTNIQFYSSDTHTVYSPQLRIQWNSSTQFDTGSLSPIDFEDAPIIYLNAFPGELKQDIKTRVYVRGRPMYPKKSFSQNPEYATVKYLPTSSYYRILDAHTSEVVVDYSNFTKLSCNSNGNYFDFSTTPLYPERFYKFEFKMEDTSTQYFSDDFLFKIVR